MSDQDRERWDEKYSSKDVPNTISADEWLIDCVQDLECGRALDLACGLGHNAIWLAQQGWTVDAIDISPNGISLARQLAANYELDVNWIIADLDNYCPTPEFYDLITVFRFLDRDHVPQIIESRLSVGGLLVYETFAARQFERDDNHLKNPAFGLQPGELLDLFSGFQVIRHEEADLNDRSVARFLGRKQESAT